MTLLATVLDDVMVAAQGCEAPFAKFHLFRAAADFFQRSRAWRQSLPPLSYRFASVTKITNASPAVVTAPGHPFLTGDQVLFNDVQGMIEINGFLYPITRIDANTFILDGISTIGWPAYSAGVIARASCAVYPLASPVANTIIVEVLSGDANVALPEDVIPGFSGAPRSGPAVIPRQPSELDAEFPGWPKCMGLPRWFHCPTESNARLVPAPHEYRNNALSLRVALAPLSDACDIPAAEFNRYRDTLVSGALARLYAVPGMPWSSQALNAHYQAIYDEGLRRAGIRARKGNTKAPSFARAVSYGGL